jgi:hypothetical protein
MSPVLGNLILLPPGRRWVYGRAVRPRVLLALLVAAVSVIAWPAITGDPLIDDRHVVPLPRPLFPANVFTPPRWQPLATLSLRAFAALSPHDFAASAQLQHVVSYALFLLALALLLQLVIERHPGDRVHPWHAFALAALVLHPSLVETFGYLSARGEAIALAALAALALALQRGRADLGVVFTLLGIAAAPAAAPAAVALGLARALDEPSPRARRDAAAIAAAAGLMALFARPSLADLAAHAARAPRALSTAVLALLVPTETALRLPQWVLSRPVTAENTAAAALPAVIAIALWRRGARGAVALVLGACLSVLPLVLRADTLEYGLDRYLSAAALLLAVAVLRARPPAWIASLSTGSRRIVGWAAVALLALLGFMTRQTASGFRSDAHQLDAMMQMRPQDPSGHLRNAWFSLRAGDRETALRSLRSARRQPLTPAMDRVARAIAARLGER